MRAWDSRRLPIGTGAAGGALVPSFDHEIHVELFRQAPVLALELLRRCAQIELVGEAVLAEVARRPIALGHPGFTLTPIVISYADVPRDPAAGEVDPAMLVPELLVLSAVAHPETGAVEAALRAILGLPAELRELYWQYVMEAAPGALPYELEVEMTPERRQEIIAYLDERLAIKYRRLVVQQGLEEGQRRALTLVLNARFGDLPPGLDERLARLGERKLGQLVTAAATSPALAAVLALLLELERAAPRTI